jgi:hypothetical protein
MFLTYKLTFSLKNFYFFNKITQLRHPFLVQVLLKLNKQSTYIRHFA